MASQRPSSYSLFPPIPAPLQRLFDLVPLVTYPANILPGEEETDETILGDGKSDASPAPTLFVFIDPVDAARGRASFNPTCLKWQTFLRFAGMPVRLAASSNHASPTGALPYLQPARPRSDEQEQGQQQQQQPQKRNNTRIPPPPRPIPSHNLSTYARTASRIPASATTPSAVPIDVLADLDPRAPAYQALLDTSLRRAWLHAVYLDKTSTADKNSARASIATRLYAHSASSSSLVRAALARQLATAAAAEVWGSGRANMEPTAVAIAQIYRDAESALVALDTLLERGDDNDDAEFFFGSKEPTIFDAAVFSYTHLLLEDDDDSNTFAKRFQWQNRTLPDMVLAHPRLVRHRAHIVERYWPSRATATETKISEKSMAIDAMPIQGTAIGNVADSVSWVKV